MIPISLLQSINNIKQYKLLIQKSFDYAYNVNHNNSGTAAAADVNVDDNNNNKADCDSTQYLDIDDFRVGVTYLLGFTPSIYQCYNIIHNKQHNLYNYNNNNIVSDSVINYNDDVCITLQQYIDIMLHRTIQQYNITSIIQQLFYIYDIDNKGYIVYDDVYNIFKQVLPHIKEHTIQHCAHLCDTHKNAMIGYREFEHIMKHNII